MTIVPLILASVVSTNIEITVVGSPIAQKEYVTQDGASWSTSASTSTRSTLRRCTPIPRARRIRTTSANARFAVDLEAFSPLDGEIYIAAENAFNRKYEYFPGYEMPGVMFYTGTKIRF